MINKIWLALFFLGYLVAGATGRVEETTLSLIRSMEESVKFILGIIGFLSFWSGLLRITEEAGITTWLSRVLNPVLNRLFPNIPSDSPALGCITLSLSANLLGLSNAATPLGIKAMKELEKLNPTPGEISEEISIYLALIMGGISLIPSTIIAIRAQAGSQHPTSIIFPMFLASLAGTCTSLLVHHIIKKTQREGKR